MDDKTLSDVMAQMAVSAPRARSNTGSMLMRDVARIIGTPHVLPAPELPTQIHALHPMPAVAMGEPVVNQNVALENDGYGIPIPGAFPRTLRREPLALSGLYKLDAHVWATEHNVLGKFAAGVGVGPAATKHTEEMFPFMPCSPPRRMTVGKYGV